MKEIILGLIALIVVSGCVSPFEEQPAKASLSVDGVNCFLEEDYNSPNAIRCDVSLESERGIHTISTHHSNIPEGLELKKEPVFLYDCPESHEKEILDFCTKFSPAFFPANQDENFIIENYPDSNCQFNQDGLIWCRDCIEEQLFGWQCIDQSKLNIGEIPK